MSQLKIPAWPKICIQLLIKASGRNYFLQWDAAFCSTEQISVSLLALFPQTQARRARATCPCLLCEGCHDKSQPTWKPTNWSRTTWSPGGRVGATALQEKDQRRLSEKPLSEVGIAATPLEEFYRRGEFFLPCNNRPGGRLLREQIPTYGCY